MRNNVLKLALRGHLAFFFCCLESNHLGEEILTRNLPGSLLVRLEEGIQPQGSTGDNQQSSEKMHHIAHFQTCNFSSYCVGPSRYPGPTGKVKLDS